MQPDLPPGPARLINRRALLPAVLLLTLATPAIMMLALDGVPTNERGLVMGTVSTSLDLAFGLGPATLGLVAAATGRAGLLAAAGVAAVGLVLVRRSVRSSEPVKVVAHDGRG